MFWVVSRVLLGWFVWCYYAVAITFLGFSEWLHRYYYVVFRALLGLFYGVTMQLLEGF